MDKEKINDQRIHANNAELFRNRGFAGPFTAMCPDEMAKIRLHIEQELLTTDGPSPSRAQSRHMDSPVIAALACHRAIIGRMAGIYGPDLIMWATNFFIKDPGAREIPWHQDLSYWPLEPMVNISAWIAIDDVDDENACVELIPGSHKSVYPSVAAGPEMAFATMADPQCFDAARVVKMALQAGQFFLFNERTLHRSPVNRSKRRRFGMSVRVTLPFVQIDQDKSPLHPGHCAILACGRDHMGLNRLMPGAASSSAGCRG